jgi:hypothetical protein
MLGEVDLGNPTNLHLPSHHHLKWPNFAIVFVGVLAFGETIG